MTPSTTDDSVPFAWMAALGAAGLAIIAGWMMITAIAGGGSANGQANAIQSFRYDRHTAEPVGASTVRFTSDEIPAVVINWNALPPESTVAAVWLDELSQPVSRSGPDRVTQLSGQAVFPLQSVSGSGPAPGPYTFVLERYSDGRPVQVLARLVVSVEPG